MCLGLEEFLLHRIFSLKTRKCWENKDEFVPLCLMALLNPTEKLLEEERGLFAIGTANIHPNPNGA
jgi:hypothetical protein